MQLGTTSRRYTLRVIQQLQEPAMEPTWHMLLLRPDDTLVTTATRTCSRAVLADGLVALASALPGLTVVYDEPGGMIGT